MTAKRILVFATVATLALAGPAAAGLVEYTGDTHGPGDIAVTVDARDSVSGMAMQTRTGRLVMTVTENDFWADYALTLTDTGEAIDMTLTDGGDGTWDVTVDFGSAGSVSYTRETDGTFALESSSITDCSGITGSDLYAAVQAGRAAVTVAATDYENTTLRKAHLVYVASVLGIVSDSVHIQQAVECESVQPNAFWNACFWYPTLEECVGCCIAADAAAAVAMVVPCAATGPFGAGGCAVALGAAAVACQALCHITNPDAPDPGEGGVCGSHFAFGNCFELCPEGTYDGGEHGCDPPLTCCLIDL